MYRNLTFLSNYGSRNLSTTNAVNGRLAGKVTGITGGASGIGKATATEFVRQGARVIIADINENLGSSTAASLGPTAAFFRCDVTHEPDVAAFVDFIVSTHGRLDIFHNNAGIAGSVTASLKIANLDLSDFDRTMSINVRGTVAGIKHAARVMVPQRSGCILCTASVTGIMGGLAPHAYSISKSAVIGAVRSAAAELGKSGIRVNAISPYAVATPLGVTAMKELFPNMEEDKLEEMMNQAGELAGAKCEAVDVARAAVYLASDEGKYVSGHNLVVDGGYTTCKSIDFSKL